jgi:hypothetical protein
VSPLDPADGVADPGCDRGARPLGGVPQPPAPAAEAGGAGELVDERVAFGRQPGRSSDVAVGVRLRQLVIEVGQPGAVDGPGPVVEDRVGAERGDRPGRLAARAPSTAALASPTARGRSLSGPSASSRASDADSSHRSGPPSAVPSAPSAASASSSSAITPDRDDSVSVVTRWAPRAARANSTTSPIARARAAALSSAACASSPCPARRSASPYSHNVARSTAIAPPATSTARPRWAAASSKAVLPGHRYGSESRTRRPERRPFPR